MEMCAVSKNGGGGLIVVVAISLEDGKQSTLIVRNFGLSGGFARE